MAEKFIKMKISANTVTITRIILMPIPGYLLYLDLPYLYFAFFVIIILAFTDWLDGNMARRDGTTVLGGLLDPIADKIFIAVCFIPFAQRMVPEWDRIAFPLWALIPMLVRDFLVTTLRTSLSLRQTPMRTSALAKYKTALQMAAVGYLLATIINELAQPKWPVFLIIMLLATCVPAAFIIKNLVRNKKPGKPTATMASLSGLYVLTYYFSGSNVAVWLLIIATTSITIWSGISYVYDALESLRGKPGGIKEIGRYVLDGILAPTMLLLPLYFFESGLISALVIISVTLELATGGLANLLASKQIQLRFRIIAIKSIAQVCFSGLAILIIFTNGSLFIATIMIVVSTLISTLNAAISFYKHRQVYLNQL